MNKTFKVVFNKARGALMVVNEATSSVQKKGTKTVIAAAVTAMITGVAGNAMAASKPEIAVAYWGEATVLESSSTATINPEGSYGGWKYYCASTEPQTVIDKFKASSDLKFVVDHSSKSTNLTVKSGTYDDVYGGDYIHQPFNKEEYNTNKSIELSLGASSVTLDGATVKRLVGGSKADNSAASTLNVANTHVTVTKGTVNNVLIGGNLIKTASGKEAGTPGGVTVGVVKEGSTVDITGGTLKGNVVAGGLTDIFAGALNTEQRATTVQSNVQQTRLNISGGKFEKSVVGGGYAVGYAASSLTAVGDRNQNVSVANVIGNVRINITGGEFASGDGAVIVGGGVVEEYTNSTPVNTNLRASVGSETVPANVRINISGGKIERDIYGGGYVVGATDKNSFSTSDNGYNAEAKVYGDTKIVISGGTITGDIIAGGNCANSSVTGTATVAFLKDIGFEETVRGGYANKTVLVFGDADNVYNAEFKGTIKKFDELRVAEGSTLTVAKIANSSDANILIENKPLGLTGLGTVHAKDITYNSGSLTVGNGTLIADKIAVTGTGELKLAGGTLQTSSDQVLTVADSKKLFGKTLADVTATKDTSVTVKNLKINGDTKGTLALTDEGVYTIGSLEAMGKAVTTNNSKASVTVVNATLALAEAEDVKLVQGAVLAKENVSHSVAVTTGAGNIVSASINVAGAGAATLKVKDSATTAGKIVNDVKINGNLTLVGDANNSALVQNADGKSVDTVNVATGITLNLGSASVENETRGTLPTLNVAGTTNVVNTTTTVEKIVAAATGIINVGTNDKRGALKTGILNMTAGSQIFLDPIFVDGATIAGASHLEITDGTSTLAGQIVVGRNSLMTFGATAADAEAGLNALGLKWGKEDISAALYVADELTPTGGIIVNGALTAFTAPTANKVDLADGSLLMIDGSTIGDQAIVGTLTATAKATVAVVNATDGKIKLADTVTGVTKVVSDTQFVDASYKDGIITTDVNEQKLAGAVASLGIVQSARRADTVFANTIADRTAQTIAGEEVSLWADVGGERYEADDLDNKAQYEANMFYGAFGADVGINPNVRVGAALQYGTGDSKSNNYSIKNDIDAVTLGLYGSYSFSENMKVVGEFAYTMSSNDIKSSERLLNNDVDADAFSLGVRGQYDYAVGAFRITPSVGLRLTRLCTDDFNVGAVKVDLDSQTLVQIPLSVAFSANIENADWAVKRYAKVSFTPTFGDDEIKVRGYDQSALDTMPVQGDFGLSATNGKVTFGAALSAGFGQDGAKSFGGKVNVRYAF